MFLLNLFNSMERFNKIDAKFEVIISFFTITFQSIKIGCM